MKIDIKATDLELTGPLKKYIEEKIGGLQKFLSQFEEGSVYAQVEVARTTQHHRHGKVYRAEATVSVPGTILRAEEDEWDVRVAIDSVKNKLQREISEYLKQQRR